MNHHVWVDMNGTLRQASSVRRHSPQGGARGYTLSRGPSNYKHWGAFCGPTTGFEIADDASKVAVVVNRQTAAVDPQSYIWYGNYNWRSSRQDVVAFTTTDAWASATTGAGDGHGVGHDAARFGGTFFWRFGALTFTGDNAGLVFWGGYNSQYNPAPDLNKDNSAQLSGTFYSWNFSTSTLSSILPASAGGGSLGVAAMSGTVRSDLRQLLVEQGLRPPGRRLHQPQPQLPLHQHLRRRVGLGPPEHRADRHQHPQPQRSPVDQHAPRRPGLQGRRPGGHARLPAHPTTSIPTTCSSNASTRPRTRLGSAAR